MTEEEMAQARFCAAQIGTIALVKALIALVCVDENADTFRSNLILLEQQATRTLEDPKPLEGMPEPMKAFVKEATLAFIAETVAATIPLPKGGVDLG